MAADVRDAANYPPILFLLAVIGCGIWALRRALRSRHARRTLVAVSWFAMPWLPISHLALRLGTLVAERTLYLPSVGAVLVAVNALRPPKGQAPLRRLLWSRAGALPVSLVSGLLATRALHRNIDWRSDVSAFESAIATCPNSAKLHQQMCTLRTGQVSKLTRLSCTAPAY